MLVKVNGESIATINGRNYTGGQVVDVTDKQYEEVKDKVDVINTSNKTKTKTTTKLKVSDNTNKKEN